MARTKIKKSKRRSSPASGRAVPDTRSLEEVAHPKHAYALLLVDVLNPMDFPEGKFLLRQAMPAARKIAKLKHRLKAAGVPVIYANDNFGLWRSEKWDVIAQATHERSVGRSVARLLLPDDDDFFILKPKHSAFFSTTLETLLRHLGTKSIVAVGLSANLCLLHTVFDGHARGFRLFVPRDCVAANARKYTNHALDLFADFLDVDIRASDKLKPLGRGTPPESRTEKT